MESQLVISKVNVIKREVSKMRVFGLVGVMVLLVAGAAMAGVPSASTSTVEGAGQGTPACNPAKAVVCPAGDAGSVSVTVTVRNVYGDPLAGKTVNCQATTVTGAFCFCPGETPQSGVSDVNGQVVFTFDNFGGCGTLSFGADCDGVTFIPSAAITIASPDNNADCVVNLVDLANFGSNYGGTAQCYDYNCDGVVNLVDLAVFGGHYGHACP